MDEGLLNDLLECSVCLERLDTSSRVLPCQHTFCIKCLKEILQSHKELRCPECRVLVEVRLEELPPNVLLMRILEGMRSRPHPHPAVVTQQRALSAQHHPLPAQHHPQPAQHHQHHPQPYTGPHARAVYDYLSKEPGDLSFKKGDIIFLKRRIDTHWYYGESGGKQGAFPMTYAKVVIPLPVSGSPQCKALYDFHMAPPDEEGCLAFEKGAVISVIRRVDENWAEGRLHERIGIFPIAFVEMNAPARALMKLSISVRCSPLQATVGAEPPVGGSMLQSGHRTDQIHSVYRQQQQQMSLSSPALLPASTPTTLAPGPLSRSQPAPAPPQSAPVPLQPASVPPQPASIPPQPASIPPQPAPSLQPDIIQLVYGSHDNAAKLLVQSLKQHQPKLQPEGAGRSGREAFLKTQANVQQFTGLTSSYHAAGGLSSDSSSTTPSLGGSSATTTPNTSSSNTSSESTTPSSPASPAYGAPPEQSRAYCNVTLQAPQSVATSEDIDTTELSNKCKPSNSSPVQNISNGSSNLTPPRSNVSSPRTCVSSQQNAVSLELSSNVPNTNSAYQNVSGRQFTPSHVACSGSGYTLMAVCQAPLGEAPASPRHSRDGLPRSSPHPREKRHSLTAQGLPQSIVQNRHSAEILSPPTVGAGEQEVVMQDLLRLGEREHQADQAGRGGESRRKERDRRRTASADRQLPAAYVALYPYKPQKADELELKKGGLYMVLERCQDGWYKGCSNRTNKCGVFPGNYVAPASRHHPNSVQHKAVSPSSSSPKAHSGSGLAGPSQRRGEGEPSLQAPPDLPPRAASPTTTSSPVFPWSSTPKTSTAKSSDKVKDKETGKTEKAPSTMSLMKRLAAMKRGKSPPLAAPNTSMDNPVFEDSSVTPPHPHPVHIRSGSCPSQLLQNSVCGTVGPVRGTRQAPGPGRHTLGAGPRARPRPSIATLTQIDRSGDVLWASRVPQPVQPSQQPHHQQHRKSQSLDAGQQLRNKDSTLTRERFRCIVAYPPNSEYELELQVDDLVLVHRKWGDGWYKGTLERTGRTGLFPASFVEAC